MKTLLTLYRYSCFSLLVPSYGRILKLICLLLILQSTRPPADRFCSVFLKVALQLKFVVSSLPAHHGLSSACAPYLSELALPALLMSLHKELLQNGRKRCIFGIQFDGDGCGSTGWYF